MLWLRGAIFTVLVPAVIGVWIPHRMLDGASPAAGWWASGWLLLGAGTLLYGWCLMLFLLSGGTPAIFFTRPVSFLIGKEPPSVVRQGPYRYSRNPMYVAVVAVILGQAAVYQSGGVFEYAVIVFFMFHLVVVLLEEPHLREGRGADYELYCRSVARWLGRK